MEWGLLQCPRCDKVLIQMKRHEKGCTGRRVDQQSSITSGRKEGMGGVTQRTVGSEEPRVLPSEGPPNQSVRAEIEQHEQKDARLNSVNTTAPTATDGDVMEEENMMPREHDGGGQIEARLDSGDQMVKKYPSNVRGATLANIGDLLSQSSERPGQRISEEGTLTHPLVLSQEAYGENVVEERGEEEIKHSFDPKHVQYVPHLWRSVPEHLWDIWRDICRPRLQAITIAHHIKDMVMMQSAIVDLLATASETLRRVRGARSIQKAHTGLKNPKSNDAWKSPGVESRDKGGEAKRQGKKLRKET